MLAGSSILAQTRSALVFHRARARERDTFPMHSQSPRHVAAVGDQGASVAGQGSTVADPEATFAGQLPAVADQGHAVADQEPYLESTEEIRSRRALLRRTVRITPLTVPVEADCATLEESLDVLQRILNALDRTMRLQKGAQASLQLDAGGGRVGRPEYCQRFAEASDMVASADEAIFMVRETIPLLRHVLGPKGRQSGP